VQPTGSPLRRRLRGLLKRMALEDFSPRAPPFREESLPRSCLGFFPQCVTVSLRHAEVAPFGSAKADFFSPFRPLRACIPEVVVLLNGQPSFLSVPFLGNKPSRRAEAVRGALEDMRYFFMSFFFLLFPTPLPLCLPF